MLKQVITHIGVPKVALACSVSNRAVYKWRERGVLPRTDFTGETNYASVISELSQATETPVTKEELLNIPR
ncbi:hypothetical protein QTO01_11355 [Vibrio mytili]|uniref:hypothetical protein n=1 Tax=Vibrio mytili TaxID=50718 RepID=UPI002F3EC884